MSLKFKDTYGSKVRVINWEALFEEADLPVLSEEDISFLDACEEDYDEEFEDEEDYAFDVEFEPEY